MDTAFYRPLLAIISQPPEQDRQVVRLKLWRDSSGEWKLDGKFPVKVYERWFHDKSAGEEYVLRIGLHVVGTYVIRAQDGREIPVAFVCLEGHIRLKRHEEILKSQDTYDELSGMEWGVPVRLRPKSKKQVIFPILSMRCESQAFKSASKITGVV